MAEQPTEKDNPFSSPSTTSDVVFVVEDRKLHVCKAILAVVSPVFERMFYGEFKEKYSSEVPLPGKKHDEMVEFLFCIYPTVLKPVDRENVEAIMMLADEYQVKRLLDKCIRYLTSKKSSRHYNFKPSVAEMVRFLHVSEDNHNLKKVYDHYLDQVAKKCHFVTQLQPDEFNQLSLETRYKVVLKRVQLFDESMNKDF